MADKQIVFSDQEQQEIQAIVIDKDKEAALKCLTKLMQEIKGSAGHACGTGQERSSQDPELCIVQVQGIGEGKTADEDVAEPFWVMGWLNLIFSLISPEKNEPNWAFQNIPFS